MLSFTRLRQRHKCTYIILRTSATLALLWTVVFVISSSEIQWNPSRLEFSENGENPEAGCNCSSILQGDDPHLLQENLYCIHVDQKAKSSFLGAVMAITSCFPNVFLVSRPVDVVYTAWPRVQADINCMADLYNISTSWKYFINLCGQDFPLKTNLEMVRRLKILNGANSMETEKMVDGKKWRVRSAHHIVDGELRVTSYHIGDAVHARQALAGSKESGGLGGQRHGAEV
ncbi:hypothetical protein CRUP_023933 [Coryphaenoides rupestris]|nr:hypothetical protein CRUP_023933 [Coryphaenoides rupestris]